MNLSIFWRVFWKEYRLQRALWLAMALIAVIAQVLVAWSAPAGHGRSDVAAIAFVLAVGLPSLYSLGCGAALFAGESEAGTQQFQRSLPAGSMTVFLAKVTFAVASMVGMWVCTMAVFMLLCRLTNLSIRGGDWAGMIWATFGFLGLETLAWAVFFSLLTRRVLVAAILGIVAASLCAHGIANTLALHGGMEPYVRALPSRAAIVFVLAIADAWLVTRWFSERRQNTPPVIAPTATSTTAPAASFSDRLQRPHRLTMLGRLVWQHWRQSRWFTVGMIVLLILVTAALVLLLFHECGPFHARGNGAWFWEFRSGKASVEGDHLLFCMTLALVLAPAPLFGVVTFLADQRRRGFRFLADHGVPPNFVWLSRQLLTLGLPTLVFLLLTFALLLLPLFAPQIEPRGGLDCQRFALSVAGWQSFCYLALLATGYTILGIAVGQCCSMFFRSVVLASLFSLLVTGILAAWSAMMLFWQVNWLWSIAPIVLALLLATRLHTRDWLAERSGLRAWLRPGLTLLVPAVSLLVAVPYYRAHQFPLVAPGFSPAEFSSPLTLEEKVTLEAYRNASKLFTARGHGLLTIQESERLTPADPEIAWVRANPKAVEAALAASRRPIGNLPGSSAIPPKEDIARLARLLVCSAAVAEKDGKLDAAFDQYLAAVRMAVFVHKCCPLPLRQFEPAENREFQANNIEMSVHARLPGWAARPGQTPERILAAMRQLDQLTSAVSPSDAVKQTYFRVQRYLAGDHDAIFDANDSFPALPPLTVLWSRLPWERERAGRMLNVKTQYVLHMLSEAEQATKTGDCVIQHPPRPHYQPEVHSTPYSLQKTIDLPPMLFDPDAIYERVLADYTSILTARRGVQLVLALEAWKLKHGSLPKTLDELVGHGLERLPVDPHTGKPFLYFREGTDCPMRWWQPHRSVDPGKRDYLTGTVAAHQPCVWACGANVRAITDMHKHVTRYDVFSDRGWTAGEYYSPRSDFEVWQSGWPFPIPNDTDEPESAPRKK
jgi:hypothetical protein